MRQNQKIVRKPSPIVRGSKIFLFRHVVPMALYSHKRDQAKQTKQKGGVRTVAAIKTLPCNRLTILWAKIVR